MLHPFMPKIVNNEATNLLMGLDFYSAQEYCNFVLFEPTYLPEKSEIITKSLQTETKKTRISHYCIVQRDDGLEFSIKQFNFSGDIETIPAYDHPNLWKCESVVSNQTKFIDKFLIQSYVLGGDNPSISDNIIWIGFNYKHKPQKALSLQMMGTSIEITLKNGHLDTEEFLKICRGLKIANHKLADIINKTPFVVLSRKYRYKENDGNVPISYWKYKRSSEYRVKMYPFQKIPSHLFGRKTCPFGIGDYYLNSAIHFLDPNVGETKEVEYCFEHKILIGSYIRLLMSPIYTGSITIPLILDDQECQYREFKCGETTIYHTYLNDEYGMHGAAWKNQNSNIMLFVKPARWTNTPWFKKLVDQMVKLISQHEIDNSQTSINPWV
jgi:hypothetical protein